MNASLRLRMVLGVALLVTLVAAGSAALCTRVAALAMTNQFYQTMRSLAENFARNAAYGVYIESGDDLSELADHLMEQRDVVAVAIFNANGDPILRSGPKEKGGNYGLVPASVYFDKEVNSPLGPLPEVIVTTAAPDIIGRVEVTYSRAGLERELAAVRWRVSLMAALAAFVGILAAAWLATRMVQPLNAITRATETIAAGNLNVRVESRRGTDELAQLAKNFNRMAQSLSENRDELKRTYEELGRKERLATLGEFTAVLAHELRNPLGIILSSAQVVSNPNRTPEMKKKAAMFIIDEVRRLNHDLTAFLDFARPKEAEPRPAEPATILKRAADSFRARTTRPTGERPTGGDHIRVEVGQVDAPTVMVDADQLHQALLNLLLNASQALGEDGGTIRLSAAEGSNGLVEFFVDDDGAGITPEARERLFEPFFTTKKKGTGLGLAIVEQIIRTHGGDIQVSESPLGGARFTIRLPQADTESKTPVF